MRGHGDDDAADPSPTADRAPGAGLRTAGLTAGFLLAVAATAGVFVTDDPQLLRLAVVGAAWAFVLAALVSARRLPGVEPAEVSALRRELADLAELRADVGRLRTELREQLSAEMPVEPSSVRTQPVRGPSTAEAPVTRTIDVLGRSEPSPVAQRQRPPVPGSSGHEPSGEGSSRLPEVLTEGGVVPPSGGRRRRRYRDDDGGDDVLARVLGR